MNTDYVNYFVNFVKYRIHENLINEHNIIIDIFNGTFIFRNKSVIRLF